MSLSVQRGHSTWSQILLKFSIILVIVSHGGLHLSHRLSSCCSDDHRRFSRRSRVDAFVVDGPLPACSARTWRSSEETVKKNT